VSDTPLHAIILVGGRGTRLQPLTDTRPKPMLPILDVPFLEHQLAALRSHGVTDVTFACGFLPQQIVAYFGEGDRVGLRLHFVIEPEPLDTAGAIAFAARASGAAESTMVVCNGDVLTSLDIGALLAFHRERGAQATIALAPVDDPSRYGLVRIGSDGAVQAFLEKPKPEEIDTNLINAGTYVLEPSVIARIPTEGRCNIEREVFPQLVGEGLYALASDAYWNDIGTFPSYLAANVDMLRGRIGGAGAFDAAGSATSVCVAPGAQVDRDADIQGPVCIDEGAIVEAGAHVGPDAVIGAGALVATGARVRSSVVLERAHVGSDAQVVDSIIGEDAVVNPGSSVSDGAVIAPGAVVDAAIVRGTA
jgi:mannose-1-phosphate guanylyltransferase